MKFFKKDTPLGYNERQENRTIKTKLDNRISHIRRKMTRGAANIFRMIKTRSNWGNKELWGYREKGRGKQGHKPPKG